MRYVTYVVIVIMAGIIFLQADRHQWGAVASGFALIAVFCAEEICLAIKSRRP